VFVTPVLDWVKATGFRVGDNPWRDGERVSGVVKLLPAAK
jgi:hypothetical protein